MSEMNLYYRWHSALFWMLFVVLGVFSFLLSGLPCVYAFLGLDDGIALGNFPTG
jgi:hypothetical protein